MSERKVLNKYYPPDFDPSNIPRSKVARNKTFTVRLMAPCNMKCNTCGEYIAKAKKFNARKEDVDDENYLGLRIYRFYIKCPMCMAEIVFKTDPEHTDYIIEAGATRNFQAQILAERQAKREAEQAEEEEKSNPMKMLENRTKQSRHEMDMIEKLEELKDLNQRQAHIDYDSMLAQYSQQQETELQRQEVEDEEYIKSVFGKDGDSAVKRVKDSDSDSDEELRAKLPKPTEKPTDLLAPPKKPEPAAEKKSWERSLGSLGGSRLAGLLVRPSSKPAAIPGRPIPAGAGASGTGTNGTPGASRTGTNGTLASSATPVPSGTPVPNGTPAGGANGAGESGAERGQADAGGGAAAVSGLGLLGAYSDSESD
ncbi:splicing factor YJU2-like isoform X2 [Pollicipes pollicipes]|uniref:splicing factor YJU2-like isoform X2 n=1 Tax=Pollicipes pollicipes TaxID=41117 RepID=UPI0018857FE6|nr:splicing factor YJU2-like isoform X2 [Pollicipes pollicipes]